MNNNLITLKEFQKEISVISDWSKYGCSDGGCVIHKPTGMHTNGGCHCRPRAFSDHLLWLAIETEKYGKYKYWKIN